VGLAGRAGDCGVELGFAGDGARAANRGKYAAIRRDVGNGMSGRAIERKHHVGRRAVIKALSSADPPERKKIHREPAALHGCIDATLVANPQITAAAI
jgi:hypothetical protein